MEWAASDFPLAHGIVIMVQQGIAWVTGNSTGHTTATFFTRDSNSFTHITAKPTEKAPTLTPSGVTGECRVYKV